MAVTFYGPWSLTARCYPNYFYTEYFEITGSDSSDGLYEPADNGTPYSTTVTGQEWTIQFQAHLYEAPAGLRFDYEPARGDGVFPVIGRFTVLAVPEPTEPNVVARHMLDVQLESLDPLLSPPWERPFDFTVREDGPYGRYLPPLASG
jgi:hypothetical protein